MIRVYMAVRRHLLTHPAAPSANDDGPLRLDRAAQLVTIQPAEPFAEHRLPRLARRSVDRGPLEHELLTVGAVTFVRWHADPDAAPRVAQSALATMLQADAAALARVATAQECRRPLDFLPADAVQAAEPWFTADDA